MKDFVNSSALTKLLANIFIFLVLVAAVGVAVYSKLNNQAIDPYVAGLLGSGITYAASILGVHIGGQQALQSQQQVQGIPPTATVPVAMQVVPAPAAPVPVPQEPGPPAGNAG